MKTPKLLRYLILSLYAGSFLFLTSLCVTQVRAQEPVVVPPSPRRGKAEPKVQTRKVNPPPAPRRTVSTIVLPEGTNLQVRLTQTLNSSRNRTGDDFEAVLDQDLVVANQVVARNGSRVVGHLSEVKSSGKVKGKARMSLELTKLYVEGNPYSIETGLLEFQAGGSKKSDAKKVGILAGIGAAIGAVVGGGKGAAIGAAAGGGAGGVRVLTTKGKEVDLRSERLLSFRLDRDVEVR